MVSPRRGFAPSPLRFVWWNEHPGAAGGGGRLQPALGGCLSPEALSLQTHNGSRLIFELSFQILALLLNFPRVQGDQRWCFSYVK